MARTVQYASSRREIWNWYWHAWRHGLWRVHAILFACATVAAILLFSSGGMPRSRQFVLAIVAGIGCIAWLPLYPILRFKPETRRLTVDEQGISTAIGKKAVFRAWTEIRSIEAESGTIVITVRNGNAFVIPGRAFNTARNQKDFLLYAQQAFQAAITQAR